MAVPQELSDRWFDSNPILRRGEPRYDAETGQLKLGDGVTPWSLLPVAEVLPAAPLGSVTGTGITAITVITQAAFNALANKSVTTAYLIQG